MTQLQTACFSNFIHCKQNKQIWMINLYGSKHILGLSGINTVIFTSKNILNFFKDKPQIPKTLQTTLTFICV